MFVLDEADVMIDQQGQQDQTIRIQRYIHCPPSWLAGWLAVDDSVCCQVLAEGVSDGAILSHLQ